MITSKQEWFINKLIREIEGMGYEFPMGYGDLNWACNDFDTYRTTCREASEDIDYLLKLKEQLEKGREHDDARAIASGIKTEEEIDAEKEEKEEEEEMTVKMVRRTYEVEVKGGQVETATEMDQEDVKTFDSLEEAKAELEDSRYAVEIETLKEVKRYYIDQHLIQVIEDEDIEEFEREDIYKLVMQLSDEQLGA